MLPIYTTFGFSVTTKLEHLQILSVENVRLNLTQLQPMCHHIGRTLEHTRNSCLYDIRKKMNIHVTGSRGDAKGFTLGGEDRKNSNCERENSN